LFPPDYKINKSRAADLVVLLVLASLATAYGIDSYSASTEILNLILVLPLTIIVLVLCLIQFVVEWRDSTSAPPARENIADVAPVIGLFAVYVISLNWLGFDFVEIPDISFAFEHFCQTAFHFGCRQFDVGPFDAYRVADPRQHIGNRIGHHDQCSYQLALRTPGISPRSARWRKQIRHIWKRRR